MTKEYAERFSGVGRLYGKAGLEKISRSHIAIIGIGGVGSWAAEALARSGVGELTLIDMDSICVTNTNRQLHAVEGQIGRDKVDAMADRVRLINPEIVIHREVDFFTESTADSLLSKGFDCVIDAIDSLTHKCHLIACCRDRKIPLVVSGGAGGKSDPTAVSREDLAYATNDKLLRMVRRRLRERYGFPVEPSRELFGMPTIFSIENARYPWADGTVREKPEPGSALKLDCASGFGTATQVTGTFGLAVASEAIKVVLKAGSED